MYLVCDEFWCRMENDVWKIIDYKENVICYRVGMKEFVKWFPRGIVVKQNMRTELKLYLLGHHKHEFLLSVDMDDPVEHLDWYGKNLVLRTRTKSYEYKDGIMVSIPHLRLSSLGRTVLIDKEKSMWEVYDDSPCSIYKIATSRNKTTTIIPVPRKIELENIPENGVVSLAHDFFEIGIVVENVLIVLCRKWGIEKIRVYANHTILSFVIEDKEIKLSTMEGMETHIRCYNQRVYSQEETQKYASR